MVGFDKGLYVYGLGDLGLKLEQRGVTKDLHSWGSRIALLGKFGYLVEELLKLGGGVRVKEFNKQ